MEVRGKMIPFEDFKATIREGERKGEITSSKPITDYDLAVQWAIGCLGEEKGYPLEITAEEIYERLPQEFR